MGKPLVIDHTRTIDLSTLGADQAIELKNNAILTLKAPGSGTFEYTGVVSGKGHLVLKAAGKGFVFYVKDASQLHFDGELNVKQGIIQFDGYGKGALPSPTPQIGVVGSGSSLQCSPSDGTCTLSALVIKDGGTLKYIKNQPVGAGNALFLLNGILHGEMQTSLEVHATSLPTNQVLLEAHPIEKKFDKVTFIDSNGPTDITSKLSYGASKAELTYTGPTIQGCTKVDSDQEIDQFPPDGSCFDLQNKTLTLKHDGTTPPRETIDIDVQGNGSLEIVNRGSKATNTPTFTGNLSFGGGLVVFGNNAVGFNTLPPNAALNMSGTVEVYNQSSCKEISGDGHLYYTPDNSHKLQATFDQDGTFGGDLAEGSFEKKGQGTWHLESAVSTGANTISIDEGTVSFSYYFSASPTSDTSLKDDPLPPPPDPGPGNTMTIQTLEVTDHLMLVGVDSGATGQLIVQDNITVNPEATLTVSNAALQEGSVLLSATNSISAKFKQVKTEDGTDITSKLEYTSNQIIYHES